MKIKNIKLMIGLISFLAVLPMCSKTQSFIVLHVNDTHSHFVSDDGIGGVTRQYTAIEETRAEYSNILVLHAGDMMTGTVYCSVFKGEMNVDLMNIIGFNYMVIGNHEFDFGVSNLLAFQPVMDFTLMSANIVDKINGLPVFTPYITTNIAGADVVLIAVSSDDLGVYNPSIKETVDILSIEETLDYYLTELQLAETNEITICLTHVGLTDDRSLAKDYPQIDLIVGGHSHSKLTSPSVVGDTWVVQAGDRSDYIGKIVFDLKDGAVNEREFDLIRLDSDFTNSTVIDDYIAEKDIIIEEMTSRVICENPYFLNDETIGNLINDMMVAYTGADIAVVNTGGIRTTMSAGDIKISDIHEVYPFENELVIATVSGEVLKKIIMRSVNGEGGFLYFSALIEVTDDAILLDGNAISDEDIFTVAASDFLYEGGDSYVEFAESSRMTETGMILREMLIQYLDEADILDEGMVDTSSRLIK